MAVVVMELHNNWKWVFSIDLQLSCIIYIWWVAIIAVDVTCPITPTT
jgi:hypothetical protein